MKCKACGVEKRIAGGGLCSACYSRLRRNGTIGRRNVVNQGRLCSVVGCEERAWAKGFCPHHYGVFDHPLKNTWKLLRNKNPGAYPPEWDRFEAFLLDAGERPGDQHKLKRIEPDKPYSKDNVRWVAKFGNRSDSMTKEERTEYGREWNIKTKFGLTAEQYDEILKDQNGVCAICEGVETHISKNGNGKRLSVDHCHTNGHVRGLLCVKCNRLLGYAKDDIAILRAAVAYLEKDEAKAGRDAPD